MKPRVLIARIRLAALLLMVLVSGVGAYDAGPIVGFDATQPDGTTFQAYLIWDVAYEGDYVIIRGNDGWYYYAELDAQGEYEPSPYKVGIDDPVEMGIPIDLKRQRSGLRQAEIDVWEINWAGVGKRLVQPDGTTAFKAYWDQPLPVTY